MAWIKINKTTVCGDEYYNTELIDVFPEEVAILGGGYTKEEALKELKANAETWLEFAIKEAIAEHYCNGRFVGLSDKEL